jgi:hypothetical protein
LYAESKEINLNYFFSDYVFYFSSVEDENIERVNSTCMEGSMEVTIVQMEDI